MTVLVGWHLGRPALWADELATDGAARLPWRQLGKLLGSVDLVFAPYYALMHVWVSLAGDSERALRIPSAAAVIGAVALTAHLGARLWGRQVGAVAGLLLAVIPATSRYGQEARPYALTMFFIVLATYLLILVSERPGPGRLATYAASLMAAVLLHPMSAMILIAHVLYLWRAPARRAAIALAIAAVLPGLTLLFVGLRHQATATSWIRVVPPEDVPGRITGLAGSAMVGAALLMLCLAALDRRRETVLVAAWAMGPIALLAIVGLAEPVWVARYVIFTLPGIALLSAYGLRKLTTGQMIAVLVAVALLGVAAQESIRTSSGHGQASRQVASVIGPRYHTGDVAVYANNHPSIPWSPRDIVARYLPAARTPKDVLALSGQRVNGHLLARECADIAACLDDAPRVWVIRADNPADPVSGLDGDKTAYLEQHYSIKRTWRLHLLTIVLLTPRS